MDNVIPFKRVQKAPEKVEGLKFCDLHYGTLFRCGYCLDDTSLYFKIMPIDIVDDTFGEHPPLNAISFDTGEWEFFYDEELVIEVDKKQ